MIYTSHSITKIKAIYLFLLASFLLLPISTTANDDPLIMGIFPRRDAPATVTAFTPLAEYLSVKLNHTVKLETTYDFASFWQGVKDQKYDIVHYNQYQYVRSHSNFGYNVIAMNEEFGKSTISSVLLVKKGSGIESIKDVPGKTLAFGGGPKAMISYILPIFTLHNEGVSTYEFKSVFAKNPPNAVMTLYFDKADIAGVGSRVQEMSAIKNNIDTSKLIKIAESEEIVQLPWAVKNSMPTNLSLQIQNLFITLNENENTKKILKSAKVSNFVKAEDADYDRTREIILDVIGIQY